LLARWIASHAARLALVALALAASSAARGDARTRVALLPLVVHSGEEREYLRQGLSDMLVSRLGRETRLAVIPVDDPKTATTDAEEARKTGVANGADYVVYGSFTRFGEGASLDLACASVRDEEREPRKVSVHADSMGALIPLLDRVAERVAFLVLGGAPSGPPGVTGPAPEAGGGDLGPGPSADRDAEPVR
jgi:outer membrane protein insertion porin family